MFNWVKNLFARDFKEKINEQLNIFEIIQGHVAWKARLEKVLKGEEHVDMSKVAVDNACALGKWLYSDGMKQFGGHEEFLHIVKVHKEFHETAGKIVLLSSLDKKEEAAELFSVDYYKKSKEIIAILNDFKK